MNRKKIVFNWSSGKDSAMALKRLLQDEGCEVALLLTTVSSAFRRVSQHGVRADLLKMQAESLGIPLKVIWLPEDLSMERYGTIMKKALGEVRAGGIRQAAFGDINLRDLRSYREKKLSEQGIKARFPIWGEDTGDLARAFLADRFRAKVVCADADYLDRSFAGREYDREFLNDLPEGVDPCGENGEFHTFVYDGPVFQQPIPVQTGEVIYRRARSDGEDEPSGEDRSSYRCKSPSGEGTEDKGFWYCDLDL